MRKNQKQKETTNWKAKMKDDEKSNRCWMSIDLFASSLAFLRFHRFSTQKNRRKNKKTNSCDGVCVVFAKKKKKKIPYTHTDSIDGCRSHSVRLSLVLPFRSTVWKQLKCCWMHHKDGQRREIVDDCRCLCKLLEMCIVQYVCSFTNTQTFATHRRIPMDKKSKEIDSKIVCRRIASFFFLSNTKRCIATGQKKMHACNKLTLNCFHEFW